MASVAILVNPARPDAGALAVEIVSWLGDQGHDARVLRLGNAERAAGHVPPGDLTDADLSDADLAVSLGGDGTFLRLVPLAYAADIPVLGVNFGRLGFLLEVEPRKLRPALERVLAGEAAIEHRVVLAVTVEGSLIPTAGDDRSLPGDGDICPVGHRWWIALNEMVAEKTVPGHMVNLSTTIDDEPFLTYNSDGVLIATPTGSTAYNLSAGGPVVAQGLGAMVLTPVAPHLVAARSLVLRADQTVTVSVQAGRPAVLVVDGREVGRLSPGTDVVCRVARTPLKVVCPGSRGFAGPLRSVLAPGG